MTNIARAYNKIAEGLIPSNRLDIPIAGGNEETNKDEQEKEKRGVEKEERMEKGADKANNNIERKISGVQ